VLRCAGTRRGEEHGGDSRQHCLAERLCVFSKERTSKREHRGCSAKPPSPEEVLGSHRAESLPPAQRAGAHPSSGSAVCRQLRPDSPHRWAVLPWQGHTLSFLRTKRARGAGGAHAGAPRPTPRHAFPHIGHSPGFQALPSAGRLQHRDELP